jgi:hypothetical protein
MWPLDLIQAKTRLGMDCHGMVWPAQSPDINVIENCWLRIKRTLQYRAGGITNSGQLLFFA